MGIQMINASKHAPQHKTTHTVQNCWEIKQTYGKNYKSIWQHQTKHHGQM